MRSAEREVGGAGGVDVEDVRQYLSSMAKCAHVLSAPVLSTPGMMSWRLLTMDFFSFSVHLHVVSCGCTIQ